MPAGAAGRDGVVGNDVQGDGKSLVIITGANSGWISRCLRSVACPQLMSNAGCSSPPQAYRANVIGGIFTHFIREEDSGMTSGRLDDELRRMSAIAGQIGPGRLVLFNESFAGTNEREASEIGYQLVRARLAAQIKVFFVTHRFGFAERSTASRHSHPVPARRTPARRAPRTTSSPSKTRCRPASGKTSTTGSAAGWRRTRPPPPRGSNGRTAGLQAPADRQDEVDKQAFAGLSLPRPPPAQEGASFGRIPQRYALAAHEPAHGNGRFHGQQLISVGSRPQDQVQVFDEGGAERDRLREPLLNRTARCHLRDVVRGADLGHQSSG